MNYDIKEVADWMVKEGHFIIHKGNYVVSAKFNTAVRGVKAGLQKTPGGKLKVLELDKAAPGMSPDEWTDMYMKFIVDCKIPKFASGSDGSLYEVNKFSKDAMLVFQKMIEVDKIDILKLTAVTKAYYSNARRSPQAISTYIKQGTWRTDYAGAPDADPSRSQFKVG